MTWFAFQGYPDVNVAGVQEKELAALGFHGYATQGQAEQNRNSVSIFQKPQLDLIEKDYAAAKATGEQPGGPNSNLAKPSSALGSAKDIVGRAIDINGFLSLLTSANTWIRVGEFVLGAMLILAGALHITGQSADIRDISKLATKVIK